MGELDLRALSAPIEALRADVQAAYERLDAKWQAVADSLRELPIPQSVSCTVSRSESSDEWTALEFRKWNGKKRICLTDYSWDGHEVESETTPFEEWSVEQRTTMLGFVPALFAEALSATKKFIEQTQV